MRLHTDIQWCDAEKDFWQQTPKGILVPERFALEQYERRRRLSAVDLFSGCGGFSLGIIQAGMEVVAAVERDVTSVITYMVNLCRWGQVNLHFIEPGDKTRFERALAKDFEKQKKGSPQLELSLAGSGWIASQPADVPGVSNMIVGDVRKLTGAQLLEIIGMEKGELGCIVGGPPCQGFSYSNSKRHAGDPRNDLVFEFARLVVETQPKTLVMENVPGILQMKTEDGHPVVERFCRILEDGGFHGVEAFEKLCRRPNALGAMRTKAGKKPRKKAKTEG